LHDAAQRCYCRPQSLAIFCGARRRRRPLTARLPEWKIAAKDAHTRFGESSRKAHQQTGVTVSSGAMRDNPAFFTAPLWAMQKAANRRTFGRVQRECLTTLRNAFGHSLSNASQPYYDLRRRSQPSME
jgi:hypothetical protein